MFVAVDVSLFSFFLLFFFFCLRCPFHWPLPTPTDARVVFSVRNLPDDVSLSKTRYPYIMIMMIAFSFVTECIICVPGHDPLTFSLGR